MRMHVPQFRVVKQQFVSQKNRLRGFAKNRFKSSVLAALRNLFLASSQFLVEGITKGSVFPKGAIERFR